MKKLVLLAFVACGGSTVPADSGPSNGTTSSGGGGKACTDIGCVDGLTIQVSGEWKPGSYVFTLTADGSATTCKGALPLPPCGRRGLECTNDSVSIGESGCALPASAHGFSDIHYRSGPAKLTVRIERDGSILADQSFTPSYRTTAPNGPGCEPVCRQASESVVLRR